MADKDIEVGDKVQWNYGGGHPQGTAAEIKTQSGEKVSIESKKGNIVSRNADEDNPAVRVERRGEGNNVDVVKRMSELTKVDEGGGGDAKGDKAVVGEKEPEVGEKRARETGVGEGGKEVEATEKDSGAPTTSEAAQEGEEPETKKTRLAEEPGVNNKGTDTAASEPPPPTKSARGRGRGRGKASTGDSTIRPKRTSGRTKKPSVTSQDKDVSATKGGEGDKGSEGVEEVMTEAKEAGEDVEPSADISPDQAPAGHTRSKDVSMTAA